MVATNNVVVVGAGVSGLTTALLLARHNTDGNKITIIAKHMPGDYDISFASPWAGANYMPVGKPGTPHQNFETETWPELERLARDVPESGVHFQETIIYRRAKDATSAVGDWTSELAKEDAWFKNVVPNFRSLPTQSLPSGYDGATAFTSVCINTPLYLSWLTSECLRAGVVLKRAILTDLLEAVHHHHTGRPASIIVNCTGLGSLDLNSVNDRTMYPVRGQIVVVRNDAGGTMYSTSGTDDGDDEAMYIMQRAAGGGTILGGCLQKGNWDSQPDPNLATRIMKRAVAVVPTLVGPGQGIEGLSVIRHAVGLRPMREGGVRVQKERVGGVLVVHNYGHGGYGYQTSYGCSKEVLRLVDESSPDGKARL